MSHECTQRRAAASQLRPRAATRRLILLLSIFQSWTSFKKNDIAQKIPRKVTSERDDTSGHALLCLSLF